MRAIQTGRPLQIKIETIMNNFYVTIIHRPEMVPEYIQKEAEQGKEEDLTRSTVLQESLDIFRTQQQIAHENGLRTTIQMTYASLFNAEAVAIAKEHHDQLRRRNRLDLFGHPVQGIPRKVQIQRTRHLAVLDGRQAQNRGRSLRQIP